MKKKTQKKINIRKIVSMKEVIDKPIDEVKIKLKDLNDIQKLEISKKVFKTKYYQSSLTIKLTLSNFEFFFRNWFDF